MWKRGTMLEAFLNNFKCHKYRRNYLYTTLKNELIYNAHVVARDKIKIVEY